jgi:iron complex outermembrane recepter protein
MHLSRRRTCHLFVLAHAPFALLATAGPADAQAPGADSVIQIPPLRVEILRSPLAGARTPYAVAGLGPESLGPGRPAAFLADRLQALPGLQIQNRHNLAVGERLAIRGFGARAQFGVRGLRVVVDGIPATLPDGQTSLDHLDLATLGRAEMLRGPGSALYGNGAGGVLLLESLRPEAVTGVTLRGSGGSGGLGEGSLMLELDGPGTGATLASLSRLAYDGFRTNPVDGGLYGVADRWTLNVRHLRPWLGGELALTVAGVDLDAENPGSLPSDSLGDRDRSAWGFNVRQRAGKTVEQFQVGGRWRGPVAPGTGEFATWVIGRDVRNPIPSDIIGLDRLAWGARTGLEGMMGGLRWGGGVDLELMRDDRTNHANEGGDEGALRLDQHETVRALGLHVRVSGDLGRASVHGALRHDRVRFEAEDRFLSDGTDDSGVRTLTGWSPSLGILVPVGGQLDLFASVSSFLETPTTTELANRPEGAGGFNPELDPTRGWTWEGGVRGRFDRRVGWELVGFRTDLRDELVPFEVPAFPGRTFFRNAGRSRHQGLEASLRAALPGGVSARAAYTRVDARFRTAVGDAEVGNRLPGRAPNRLEGVIAFEGGPVHASLDLAWNDAVPADDANSAEAPAHTLVGFRISMPERPLGGRLTASPFMTVRNLFDEDHVASVVPNAFGGRYFEPGPGRELRAGIAVSF